MAEVRFGTFEGLGGISKEQEKALALFKKGQQRKQAQDIKRLSQLQAQRGIGRAGFATQQIGDIAQQYAERIGGQEAQLRTGAEQQAYQRWLAQRTPEFQARVQREEAQRQRGFQASQAELERTARMKEIEKSKEKDIWDIVGSIV